VTASRRRFPLVDSLRAVAAGSVLLLHTAGAADRLGPHALGAEYLQRLNVGVWIFFVISGFVLFRPFALSHLRGEPEPRAGVYAWRRAARIVPAYWVALAVAGLALPGLLYARNIPWTFGYAQIYRSDQSGMGIFPAWTLCVEVTFYLFLPVYSLLVGRLARRPGAWLRAEVGGLAVLCAIGVGYRLAIYGGDGTHLTHLAAGNFLPGWLDLFSLGMGLAVVQVWLETRPDAPGIVRVIERFPALCWLIAAVAFWWVATRCGLATSPDYSRWTRAQILDEHWFFAVVAFAVMVPAVIGDTHRGRVRRLLGQRWMLWLGAVSYGVYLWQVPWLLELKRLGLEPGPWRVTLQWLLFGVGGTIALGALSYHVVERPALRLSRLAGRLRAPRRAVPVET
jgi:peptidoglycan/LPS O-acetylase OafA/YrhL